MPDILSSLTHSKLPLAKTWHKDGSISDYAKPKHFSLEEITIHNINDLSTTLRILEKRKHTCLIRGKYTGDQPNHTMRRKEVFADQPLHSFMAEIDKYRPILCDPTLEPVEAIEEYILTQLPACFQNVSYHWQLSNSAGSAKNAGILKAHVWFWILEPYTSAQMKAWIKNQEIALDPATADIVQIHYTAAPVFDEGVSDPVPKRSGFVSHTSDSVNLILDPDSLEAQAKEVPRGEAYQGNDEIALWLEENNIAKGIGDNGKLFLDCPFSENHTDGKIGETDTTYLPSRPGFPDSLFHCSHASCLDRSNAEFENALGITASYFDVIEETIEEKLEKKKKLDKFSVINIGDYMKRPDPQWLIKGLLPEKGTYQFYGGSGDGKTFAVLDMMIALCRGVSWNGLRVMKKCRVVYICAEGAGGFITRLKAIAHKYKIDLSNLDFGVIADTPSFRTMDDVKIVQNKIKEFGVVDIVIIDTFAQVTAGGDENSGKDMGLALKHIDILRASLDCAVGIVHHAGKDVNKGSRGWSGIKAVLDAQFLIYRKDGKRFFWVDKLKDGIDSYGWEFELESQPLYIDADGDMVTSCAVNYKGLIDKAPQNDNTKGFKKSSRGKNQNTLMDTFMEINGGGEVHPDKLKEVMLEKLPPAPRKGQDKRAARISNALDALIEKGELKFSKGMLTAPLEG